MKETAKLEKPPILLLQFLRVPELVQLGYVVINKR